MFSALVTNTETSFIDRKVSQQSSLIIIHAVGLDSLKLTSNVACFEHFMQTHAACRVIHILIEIKLISPPHGNIAVQCFLIKQLTTVCRQLSDPSLAAEAAASCVTKNDDVKYSNKSN